MEVLQTQEWRRDSEDIGEQGLRFSLAAVNHLKLRIDEHNAAWQSYFERCNIEPLRVVYEEFVERYEESLVGLLEGIGIYIPEDFTVEEPKMKRQADETSEEWVRLYQEGKAAEAGGQPRKV